MIPRWELISPAGVASIEPMTLTRRPRTLEGKTVLLRWNGKPNGDIFLDRVAALLAKHVRDVRIIKAWEIVPDSVEAITGSQETSISLMKKLATRKPDLVIGSQGD